MGVARTTLLGWLTIGLAACAADTPAPVSPEARAHATTPATATVARPSAEAKRPAVVLDKWTDLDASPGAQELEAGAAAAAAGDWAKARRELADGLGRIGNAGRIDAILAGQALLGRACVVLRDTKCAERAFESVLGAWQGPKTERAILEDADNDVDLAKPRLQRAILAVAEALFFKAERQRDELNRVTMPTYKGQPTKAAIDQFIEKELRPWISKKGEAAERVEQAYGMVGSIEPAAAPGWLVDASARVGQVWGKFRAELRAAPIPAEWKQNGAVPGGEGATWADVRKMYFAAVDIESEPLRDRARRAYERCRSNSVRFGHKDGFTRSCEAWLEHNR
ncbi:MAG: hypothetical protein HOW73_37670 [Polyangiaceae bacterium]|nr:hypothetical protein [Polyangiaceae bacterium]